MGFLFLFGVFNLEGLSLAQKNQYLRLHPRDQGVDLWRTIWVAFDEAFWKNLQTFDLKERTHLCFDGRFAVFETLVVLRNVSPYRHYKTYYIYVCMNISTACSF